MLTKWGYMGGQKPLQGCYKNHVHKQRSRTNYPVPWHELPCAMARSTMCHGTNYFVPFLRKKENGTVSKHHKFAVYTNMCHGTKYNVPWHELQCAMARNSRAVCAIGCACGRAKTGMCPFPYCRQCYGLWLHLEGGWVQM